MYKLKETPLHEVSYMKHSCWGIGLMSKYQESNKAEQFQKS